MSMQLVHVMVMMRFRLARSSRSFFPAAGTQVGTPSFALGLLLDRLVAKLDPAAPPTSDCRMSSGGSSERRCVVRVRVADKHQVSANKRR